MKEMAFLKSSKVAGTYDDYKMKPRTIMYLQKNFTAAGKLRKKNGLQFRVLDG